MQLRNLNLICVVLLLISTGLSYAQGGSDNMFAAELDKMVKIPNSPEAEALAKYGDVDVSLFTGTPNIGIPIHRITGREMNLPVSLSYDASGIKIEQLATWVGLGWHLNVGGRVSRIVNGLADDYLVGNYVSMNDGNTSLRQNVIDKVNIYREDPNSIPFNSEQEVRDYFFFLDEINKNLIDAQPDLFQVNAPGLTTTLVFDSNDNNIPKSLDNPRIRIDSVQRGSRGNNEILGWRITGEDGTRYTFGVANGNSSTLPEYEMTKLFGDDIQDVNGTVTNEYISSWVLTKIESPNKKDVFEFEYFDTGYISQPLYPSAAIKAGVEVLNNKTYYSELEVSEQYGGGAGYWISQLFITQIKHNGTVIMEFNRGFRADILHENGIDARLDHILVYGYDSTLQKRIDFNNDSYFNENASISTEKRLKLDKVSFKDANQSTVENYFLEYDRPELLPARTDKGQDYGGYYNGANNQVLFPRYEYEGFTFEGANRDPSECHARVATLNRITYPTGGYSQFEYELNKSLPAPQDAVNQEWTNVLYAEASVTAGTDSSTPCGPCCQDMYGSATPPKVVSVSFNIEESDHYNIDFIDDAVGGNIQQAVILQRDGNRLCYNSPEGQANLQPVPYDEIFDPNTCFLDNRIVWSGLNPVDKVYLTRGCYQVTLVIGNFNSNSLNLQVWRPELQSSSSGADNELVDRPGLRIKSIKNHDANGSFASGKLYDYPLQKTNHLPILSRTVDVGNKTFIERTTSYPQGEGPMITYPEVIESQVDATGNTNGSIKYTFNDRNGGRIPSDSPPYQFNYFPKLTSGKLKGSETFDNDGELIAKQEITYYETLPRPVSVKGLVVATNLINANKYPYIKENNDGTYGYELVNEPNCNFDSGGSGATSSWDEIMQAGFNETAPDASRGTPNLSNGCSLPCVNNWQNCNPFIGLMDRYYGRYEIKKTFVNGAFGGVEVTKNIQYLKDADDNIVELETISENLYDKTVGGYYRPLASKTTDSKGHVYRRSFTYASDGDTEYQVLFDRNRLAEVVASQTERLDTNDNVLEFISARKNEYFVSSNVILPFKIFTSKEGVANLEERFNFSYYPNGNIKESKQVNGPSTTYLWGYNDMYPVGKIDNAELLDINGINYSSAILQDVSSSDSAIQSELGKIRNGLPSAMITSYTYSPGIGMTSMVDPRGYMITYEYDAYHRLKVVRDALGNPITDYDYAYKQAVSN